MDGKRIILAAHRGDRKLCPENTMPAFEAALKLGCDMIEMDLHMTADGELVIMHDRSAKRTAGVDRNIDEMTLAQVKELDAGALFSEEFRGTPVPTVREFCQWLTGNNLMVNWELKDYPKNVGDEHAFACADKLVALIEEYGLESRSMLNSFSDRVIEHLYRQHGHRFPLHGQGIYHCPKTCDHAEISEEEMYDWCCMPMTLRVALTVWATVKTLITALRRAFCLASAFPTRWKITVRRSSTVAVCSPPTTFTPRMRYSESWDIVPNTYPNTPDKPRFVGGIFD